MAADDVLGAVQRAFVASSYEYTKWTLSSGRELRVIAAVGAPDARYTTFISFDGVLVEWPDALPGRRILPVVVTHTKNPVDASFHAAWLLDAALTHGVPPRAREIVVTLGHNETLPHVRYDHPYPWEQKAPLEIAVDDLSIVPVMAYSVSQAETDLQIEKGWTALETLFEQERIDVFDRQRKCALAPRSKAPVTPPKS